ncbi:hypothetical protein GCM10012284_01310 [Mangrovihabitans endophyticus]|uniref:Transglycosylase SLT domain-containing protein n=2 Tax=Mangrovihabitans endophyticus TaxID=1751298 RepID=A0A8J3FK67_9ACTN|nr:hypothetical protein GCM10012284_01310 [Mangrovihabitans endophyticus]
MVAAAVAMLVLTGGCGLVRPGGDDTGGSGGVAARPVATPEETFPIEAVPETSSASPSPSSASPKPSRTARSHATSSPTPTQDPNFFQEPACAEHEGTKVSKAKAKSALVAAAGKRYWPTSAPGIKISKDLVKSVAWHESGWQSNIVNCDGGRGLMQVMPDTEAFINQRFGQSYDVRDYRENAVLGANYLAWLTKALGDDHFDGDYDLSPSKCPSHGSRCLLNLVIAGYNAGRGAVDEAYAEKRLPNPEYVDSVRSLMESCYCDRY